MCLERFLASAASTEETSDILDPEMLQATFFPDLLSNGTAAVRPHKFNPTDLLKLRALAAVAVCQYELALQQDPSCLQKSTVDAMIGACLVMQQTMQVAQLDESIAWLVYNGTVFMYKVARQLLPAGYAARCLQFVLWSVVLLESIPLLATVKYLPWRVQLYTTACQCYFEIRHPSVITLAQRCIARIAELERLESLSSSADSDSEFVFEQARASIALVVFRHEVWHNRRRRFNSEVPRHRGVWVADTMATPPEWPRSYVEDMLLKQFQTSDQRLLAVVESLANNQRRTLQPCTLFSNDSPENFTVDRDTLGRYSEITSQIFAAGRELCLRELGLTEGVASDRVLTFVRRAFNYEQNDTFRELSDVLLGNRSVHEILNNVSIADADRSSGPLPERVTGLQRKYIAVLTTFMEARQSNKSKQQDLVAYGIFSTVQPMPPRMRSRTGFPSKVATFVEALDNLLTELDSSGSEDSKDCDLINDAALFLWARTKTFYSRFNVASDVEAAVTSLVNIDPANGGLSLPTLKLKTLMVVHRALIACGASVSDPLVCGQVAIKLSTIWEGLKKHEQACATLSEALDNVRLFRSFRALRLDPVCMVTTDCELQEEHKSSSPYEGVAQEISSKNDGLAAGLEFDLLSQLWSAKLRSRPAPKTKPASAAKSASTRRLGAARRAKRAGGAAQVLELEVGEAGPDVELGLGETVSTLLKECGDNALHRVILLGCAAEQAVREGTASSEKIGAVLAHASRSLRSVSKAEIDAAKQCSEANDALQRALSDDGSRNPTASTGDVPAEPSPIAAPAVVYMNANRVVLRVVPGNYERSATVRSYRLFGRLASESVSGASHVVRLQDYKLQGTNIDLQVTSNSLDFNVTGLQANAAYIFAVAMFDDKGNVVGSIGPPTRPVVAAQPLSIRSTWGFLASAAFQAGVDDVLHTGAEELWHYYVGEEESFDGVPHNGNQPLCLMNSSVSVASTSELQLFCRCTLMSLSAKIKDAGLVANALLHTPDIQSAYPLRLAYGRRLLIICEIALSIHDATVAIHAATKCYSILAPMIFYGTYNKSALQLLVICHQTLCALIALPSNNLPDVAHTHDFHHMCACLTMTIVKAFHKRGELVSATAVMNAGIATLNVLAKLSPNGSGEVATSAISKKKKASSTKKKKSSTSVTKPYCEHIVGEMSNFGQWLAALYSDRTSQKTRVRVPNLYINLFNPRKRHVPEFDTSAAHRKDPQYFEKGTRWVSRAIERGQNEKAVAWAQTLIRQGSMKGSTGKGPRDLADSKPSSRISSAIVRHSTPGAGSEKRGSSLSSRKSSKSLDKELTEEQAIRKEVTLVMKQNRTEFGLVDATAAEFEQRLQALVTLRLLLQQYLKRKRLERESQQSRQVYLRDGARWIAQLNLLAGIALLRLAKKVFEESKSGETRPQHTPRRFATNDGKVTYFPQTPPSCDELDYTLVNDALDHLRRAAILSTRACSWIQVHNVTRVIFNVTRYLGQVQDASPSTFSLLQLTFASAMMSVGEMMRAAQKLSPTGSAKDDTKWMSERFNVEFARDFFLEGVRLLTDHEGRFFNYVIDSGLAILRASGGLCFTSIYLPLLAVFKQDPSHNLSILEEAASEVDPDGSLRQGKAEGFLGALTAAVLSETLPSASTFASVAEACKAEPNDPEAKVALGDVAFASGNAGDAEKHWIAAALMMLHLPASGGIAQLGSESKPGTGFALNGKAANALDQLSWWNRLELIAVLGKLCRYTSTANMDNQTLLCRLTGVLTARAVLSCDGDLRWSERDYAQGILDSSLAGVPLSDDRYAGSVETVVASLSYVCNVLLTAGFALEALPVIAVYEVLGMRACRSIQVCIDARLLRLAALSKLGLYVAAFKLCVKVLLGLNLPVGIDHLERSSGIAGTALRKMEAALPDHSESDHAAYWGSPKTVDAVTVMVSLRISPTAASIYGHFLTTRVEIAHADLMSSFSMRLLVAPHPGPGTQFIDLVTPDDEPWDENDPHAETHARGSMAIRAGSILDDDDDLPSRKPGHIPSRDHNLNTLQAAASQLASMTDAPLASPSIVAGHGGSGAEDLKAEHAAHSLTEAADNILNKVGANARAVIKAHKSEKKSASAKKATLEEASVILFNVAVAKSRSAAAWERHSVAAHSLDAALSYAEHNGYVQVETGEAIKHLCTLTSELKSSQNDDVCIAKADSAELLAKQLSCTGSATELVTFRSICKLRQGMASDGVAELEALNLGTGTISEHSYAQALAVLGDEYSKQGNFAKALKVYKEATECLEAFTKRLFRAKLQTLLSDSGWTGIFMPELRLLAKVRTGLSNAANNLPDLGFALESSRIAVKLAMAVCPDLVQVVGVGLLANVRAERRASGSMQATMVLKRLCTHLSTWRGAGYDFDMVRATCIEIAESQRARRHVAATINAILAATDAASALHCILRWEQNESSQNESVLDKESGVMALEPPAVRLPLLPPSESVDIETEELPTGKVQLAELRQTVTLRSLLQRRSEIERLRSCAPFADDNTTMSLRELELYLEQHHPKALPTDSTDLPGLLIAEQTAKVTEPVICLHWWCDHVQATTTAMYFVGYISDSEQLVGRVDYKLSDVLSLRARTNADVASGTLSASECALNIARLLGDFTHDAVLPELPAESITEVIQLLNPAYGGRSATPEIVNWFAAIFRTIECVRPATVASSRLPSGTASPVPHPPKEKAHKNHPPSLNID